MIKDTSKSSFDKTDPLGIQNLSKMLESLKEHIDNNTHLRKENQLKNQLFQILDVVETINLRYDLMKDRYFLMKKLTSQLCNEVGWLRDQCDDLSNLKAEIVDIEQNDIKRRYEDRL